MNEKKIYKMKLKINARQKCTICKGNLVIICNNQFFEMIQDQGRYTIRLTIKISF